MTRKAVEVEGEEEEKTFAIAKSAMFESEEVAETESMANGDVVATPSLPKMFNEEVAVSVPAVKFPTCEVEMNSLTAERVGV